MSVKVALLFAALVAGALAQGDLPAPTAEPDGTDAPASTEAPPQPTPPSTDAAAPAATLGSCCKETDTCPPNYPRCLPVQPVRLPGDVECCQADPCNGVLRCPTWRPAPSVDKGTIQEVQSCCSADPCTGRPRCGPAEIPVKIIPAASSTAAASATTAAAATTTVAAAATTAAAATATDAAPTPNLSACCAADPCTPGLLRCPSSSGVGPLGKLAAPTCGCLQQAVCPCRQLVEAVTVDSSVPACPCAGAPSCGCAVYVPQGYASGAPSFSVPQAIIGAAAQTNEEHNVHRLSPAFTTEQAPGVPTGLVGSHRGSRCGCVHMPSCPCRASWVKPEFSKRIKFTSKNISPQALAKKQARAQKRKAERLEAERIALGDAPVKSNANLTEADSVRSLGPRRGDCTCGALVQAHLIAPSHCPCLNANGQAVGWVAPRLRRTAHHKIVPQGSLSCCTADPCSGAPRCPGNADNVAVVGGTFVRP